MIHMVTTGAHWSTSTARMNGSGDARREDVLLQELHKRDVFKLGEFVLKSGLKSPIYIDLRVLISSPKILRLAADCVCDKIRSLGLKFDYIVGVPYAALPIATLVCDRLDTPMLLRRKEAKAYGTKKLIEGNFERGGRALVIEDVVTSGGSILETCDTLRKEGLVCGDVICVLDREQGGAAKLMEGKVALSSVLSMTKILDFLVRIDVISVPQKLDIIQQLAFPTLAAMPSANDSASNKLNSMNAKVPTTAKDWSIAARCANAKNPLTKRLLDIMNKKKTGLCLAIDHTTCEEVLKTVQIAQDYVCAIKLHVDVLEDFNEDFIKKLTAASNANDFIIFEDRKLADTGNTVELQVTKGLYNIASWAHIVTVHALPGQPILTAIRKVIQRDVTKMGSCLLIAELSTQGALTNLKEYRDGVIQLAKVNRDVVSGFICQNRCLDDPSFVYWTPGVNLDAATDGAGQQWRSVEKAICEQGNDIIIVGRAITDAADIHTQMRRYRDASWEAILNRIH